LDLRVGKERQRRKNKFDFFLKSKKEIILLGFWLANLYLITKIFGNYMGVQFGTFLAVCGTVFIHVIKDKIEESYKKYGIKKVLYIILGITILHTVISIFFLKPLKSPNQ